MRQTIFYVLGLLLPSLMQAQMQLGWRADNFSGINSALLNPAAPLNTPYAWDFNLIEGASFLANNYAYVEEASLGRLLRAQSGASFLSAPEVEGETKPEDFIVDYFRGNRKRFAAVQAVYMGPSLSVRVAPLTRLGLFTRARAMTTARQIDEDLSFYNIDSRPANTPITIDPFQAATAAWAELGLNLSQGILLANDAQINLGLSARRLFGYEAAYVANERSFVYTRLSQDLISGQAPTFSAAFTDSWAQEGYTPQVNGKGWGFDLGFQYLATDGDGGYRWKMGASLLDIGSIEFDQNAQMHELSVDSLVRLRTDLYGGYNDINQLDGIIQQFSADVLADSFASQTGTSFRLVLPTVLSFQFDLALAPDFFVGLVWAGNMAPDKSSLQQGSILAITPRWERYWWGVSAPVTVYEWQQLRVGLALRLGPITLGSDHLGSLLGQQRFSGTDFYAAIKFFPWGIRKGNDGPRVGSRQSKARRGREVECYKF